MKKLQIKIEVTYCIDVEDDFDYESDEDIQNTLSDYIMNNNMTCENEFIENFEVICGECGITLSTDEEKKDGYCTM